jgi:hypothetical protein
MAKKRAKLFAEALAAAQDVNRCITELIRLGVPLTPSEQAKLERMLCLLLDEIDAIEQLEETLAREPEPPVDVGHALRVLAAQALAERHSLTPEDAMVYVYDNDLFLEDTLGMAIERAVEQYYVENPPVPPPSRRPE